MIRQKLGKVAAKGKKGGKVLAASADGNDDIKSFVTTTMQVDLFLPYYASGQTNTCYLFDNGQAAVSLDVYTSVTAGSITYKDETVVETTIDKVEVVPVLDNSADGSQISIYDQVPVAGTSFSIVATDNPIDEPEFTGHPSNGLNGGVKPTGDAHRFFISTLDGGPSGTTTQPFMGVAHVSNFVTSSSDDTSTAILFEKAYIYSYMNVPGYFPSINFTSEDYISVIQKPVLNLQLVQESSGSGNLTEDGFGSANDVRLWKVQTKYVGGEGSESLDFVSKDLTFNNDTSVAWDGDNNVGLDNSNVDTFGILGEPRESGDYQNWIRWISHGFYTYETVKQNVETSAVQSYTFSVDSSYIGSVTSFTSAYAQAQFVPTASGSKLGSVNVDTRDKYGSKATLTITASGDSNGTVNSDLVTQY